MEWFDRRKLRTLRPVLMVAFVFIAVNGFSSEGPLGAPAATPNSITLTWTAPGDDGATGTATLYDIRYSLSPINDANWDAAVQADGEPTPQPAGSAESFTVTGLLPSTTYYFGIKAADEVFNWSVLSNIVSKSTSAEDVPPDVIADLTTGSPGLNSMVLYWTAPGDDGSSGMASQYDIRYSTLVITDANWDAAVQVTGEPSPQSAGSSESFTVTGLNESTTYYFAIKTADEVPNWSGLSNVASGTTATESTPPAVIADLVTGAVTTSSIALDWTAPGDDGTVGTASQYDLRYSTSVITDINWGSATQVTGLPAPQPSGSAESFTVTGLADNTTYYFAIKAADEVPNWSGLSNLASATTESDIVVPPAPALASPANGAIDLVQPITLDWYAVTGADNYQVQVADNSSMTAPIRDTATIQSDYDVSGLDYGGLYYWRARAHNTAGWGGWSAVRSFTVECPLPDVPILASPADGAVNLIIPVLLDWNDAAFALNYVVQIDETADFSSPVISTTSSASSYNATSLNEDQLYYWRIRSNNDCGISGWSIVRSFNTLDTTDPAPIAGLNAAPGENDGEVILTWTATGDNGNTGTADSYDIRYSLAPITEVSWPHASRVSGEPAPQPAGSEESLTIGGLDNSLTYYFGIKVADEVGNSSTLSNVPSTLPADKTPPAGIIDLSGETGSADGEIFLGWTAPGDDNNDGMVSAYLIRYSKKMINDGNWEGATIYEEFVAPLASGQLQSVIMTGLEPGADYYIGIKAYDECANCSELSNVVSCTAGEDLIVVVDDQNTEPVSPGSGVTLHSSRPVLAVYNILSQEENIYFFEVARDSFFIDMAAVSPPVPQQDGGTTSWKIDQKLDGNQTYFWRARANDFSYCATSTFSVQPRAHAYPNPYNLSADEHVTFTDIPEGAGVVLMSVSGATIREWSSVSGDNLTWNGTDESGRKVASGTYLWFVEDSDASGKIVVMH